MRAWRWPARLAILAAVGAAFYVDSNVDPPEEEVVVVTVVDEPRLVPSPDALTSTWFCPVVAISADDAGVPVQADIRVANLQPDDVEVSVTAISPTTTPVTFLFEVAAGTVESFDVGVEIDEEGKLNFYQGEEFVTRFGLDDQKRPYQFYQPNPDGSYPIPMPGLNTDTEY